MRSLRSYISTRPIMNMSSNASFIANLSTYEDPGSNLVPSYSSSPLSLAGFKSPPVSTLDVGTMTDEQFQSSTQSSIADIINGLGNVVLGGIAVSRMPATNITSVKVPTTIAGRTTGTTIVPASATALGGSTMSLLLVGLVIVGIVLLAKKL